MFFIQITIVLLFFYAKCSGMGVTVNIINSDDFVFPLVKSEDFSMCIFQNGTTGQCVNASQCANVRNEYQSGISPTLCYFDKNEPVVCCVSAVTENSLPDVISTSTLRPSYNNSNIDIKIETTTPQSDWWQLLQRRKSDTKCDFYSLPVPFESIPGVVHATVVGGQVTLEGEFPHMVR